MYLGLQKSLSRCLASGKLRKVSANHNIHAGTEICLQETWMFECIYLPHRGVIWVKRQWLWNPENEKLYANAQQSISGYVQDNSTMDFPERDRPQRWKRQLWSTPAMFPLLWFLKADNTQVPKERNSLPETAAPTCKIWLLKFIIKQADYIIVTLFNPHRYNKYNKSTAKMSSNAHAKQSNLAMLFIGI